MTKIMRLLFYMIILLQMIYLVKILIYFLSHHTSLPIDSATRLSAALLCVQCVWVLVSCLFLFSRLSSSLENQGGRIISVNVILMFSLVAMGNK